ncbi:MAG TPA: AI-2E family transporter [Polyangiaceae bacterium]|nr:AI-2E family transporter [Polyangiaceae bacterium]
MPDDAIGSLGTRRSPLLTLCLVGLLLYVAQAVFIPLALALLLSFLLVPVVHWLERRRVPRPSAVVAVLVLSFAAAGGVMTLLVSQTIELADRMPEYSKTIRGKLGAASASAANVERFVRIVNVFDAVERMTPGKRETPIKVEVVPTRLDAWRSFAGPLLAPLATTVLVLAFAIFMLIQWDDLGERVLRLSGQRRISLTTRALQDAGKRVSRYLAMQLTINVGLGFVFAFGLGAIGIPNAPLSGVLLALLRFIPYVGAWIAGAFPLALAFAVTDSWTPLLFALGLLIVLEIVAGQFLEPLLYGAKTGLSPLGTLISFLFWGWMWGGVGMLLAMPLTVCLVVAGRYLPQLETISILLGDQRALAPWARLYLRLLALDPDEASEIYAAERKRTPELPTLYDDVLAPALSVAERDSHDGQLSDERRRLVYSTLRHFAEEDRTPASDSGQREGVVLCLAARNEADFVTALMAAQVLERTGFAAEAVPHDVEAGAIIERIAVQKPGAVLVAALPQVAVVSAHEQCRRIRDLFPDLPIVVGIWKADDIPANTRARLRAAGADELVTTFQELVQSMKRLSEHRTPTALVGT